MESSSTKFIHINLVGVFCLVNQNCREIEVSDVVSDSD